MRVSVGGSAANAHNGRALPQHSYGGAVQLRRLRQHLVHVHDAPVLHRRKLRARAAGCRHGAPSAARGCAKSEETAEAPVSTGSAKQTGSGGASVLHIRDVSADELSSKTERKRGAPEHCFRAPAPCAAAQPRERRHRLDVASSLSRFTVTTLQEVRAAAGSAVALARIGAFVLPRTAATRCDVARELRAMTCALSAGLQVLSARMLASQASWRRQACRLPSSFSRQLINFKTKVVMLALCRSSETQLLQRRKSLQERKTAL